MDSDDSLEEDVVVAPPIENAHSQKNRKKGVTFSSNIEASHHIRVDDPVSIPTLLICLAFSIHCLVCRVISEQFVNVRSALALHFIAYCSSILLQVTAVTKAVEFVSGHTDSILRNKDTKSPLDENAIAAIKAAESGPRVVPSSLTAFPGQVVERGVVGLFSSFIFTQSYFSDYCSQEPSTSAVEPTKPISKFKRQRAKN